MVQKGPLSHHQPLTSCWTQNPEGTVTGGGEAGGTHTCMDAHLATLMMHIREQLLGYCMAGKLPCPTHQDSGGVAFGTSMTQAQRDTGACTHNPWSKASLIALPVSTTPYKMQHLSHFHTLPALSILPPQNPTSSGGIICKMLPLSSGATGIMRIQQSLLDSCCSMAGSHAQLHNDS